VQKLLEAFRKKV
jgi:calcyphosin